MTKSKNLGLNLPSRDNTTDLADINVVSENFETIDNEFGNVYNKLNNSGVVNTVSGNSIVLKDSASAPLQNLKLFGKTTQNGTPTPSAPVPLVSVGDSGSFEVGLYGRNLIEYPYHSGASYTLNDITYTADENGIITVNGTSTSTSIYYLMNNKKIKATETIYIKNVNGYQNVGLICCYNLNGKDYYTGTSIPKGAIWKTCYLEVKSGATLNNVIVKPTASIGEVATEYEPPKAKQTLTMPYTLPSMDTIKQEVDFNKGIIVKKLGVTTITSSDNISISRFTDDTNNNWNTRFFVINKTTDGGFAKNDVVATSDYFPAIVCFAQDRQGIYSHRKGVGIRIDKSLLADVSTQENAIQSFKNWLSDKTVNVVYQLPETIETPLTETELNAYKKLHTNKPTTTILGEADMEVTYVADTKLYIDNKIAELTALTLEV